jgi:hypothetical protein
VEKRIRNFADFVGSRIDEGDGFGTLPFLQKRDGDLFYYFFQLELENGGQKGIMFMIGKYSQYETMEGPKNSYAVLNVNEIAPEIIEDIAMGKAEIPEMSDGKFRLRDNDMSRYFEQISKAILSYLEKNPKVIRIFDEMQDHLEVENYGENMKSILLSFIGPEWSIQEGSHEGTFIISR